ncbi:non-ribosomal peptide synthetase [Streptomyces profundus]|uniref:non-ribosomal peptide synthetase n=1 Tax=Streptomyces profundus TaxID=2867410 RepID=UPI001D1641B6|nr:non-ribosomal peptide synthetase [Streptomyces sp. MA3_2.13]UED87791.1 amino acid adenylation domain-containing protein [Streptomyces sp. MA3_2.13]
MSFDECATAVLGPEIDTETFASHSFVGLGGDSLRAMRLAAVVRERLGVRLPMAALLSSAPLAEVFATASVTVPAVEAAPSGGAPAGADALSSAQRGMWLIERVTGGSPYNLVFTAFASGGRWDPGPLAEAVAGTVARHPGLRTVYREADDEVAPEVLDGWAPTVEIVEQGDGEGEFTGWAREVAAGFGRRPFDLAAEPALRFLRLEGPAGGQALVLAAHHMVLDGWAVGLLLREVFARYAALAEGRPVPDERPGPGPEVLAARQEAARANGVWERQAEFWVKRLDGVPTVLELPADRRRPALQDPSGARVPVVLGAGVSAAVVGRARELGVTSFAFLLGAWALTLSRRTGAHALLVGVPVTGRDTAELERLVGVAGNLVPVRVDVDDDAGVDGYLRSVHHSLALGMDAGELPFEELVGRLGVERGLGCHPLVQVSFGMHDQLVPRRIEAGRLAALVEEGHGGGAQFDLSLLISRAEPALAGHLEYATGVFGAEEATALVADFLATVEALVAAGDGRLAEVRGVSPAGRALLDELNDVRRDFPAVSLAELFLRVVRRAPDAVAVRDESAELTYAQLARSAARQAARLRAAGVGPGDRVVVALPRSVAEAVAVLGVVWASAAYVGVDLAGAAEHTARIVERAAPKAALVAPGDAAGAEAFGVPLVPVWDPSWAEAAGSAGDGPDSVGPDGLAYVAFTSGSTGRPKGVAVPHRAVVRLVHQADFVRLGPGERVLRLSPLAFDASTLEVWGALLTGATLEVLPPGLPSPSDLGEFLTERGVTVAWLTAGLFRLVEEFAPDALGGLRQLLTGGDVVPHEHVARVLARHPGLVVTNGYGPTENTTFTTTHSVRSPAEVDGPLPIGRPVPGTRVYVLDERRRLVPPGGVGELYTGGEGLALGYLGDEAETARGFGAVSPDVPERVYRTGDLVRVDSRGRLCFIGRRDSQVKLRGYRVELSAISDELTAEARVQDAVVTVSDGDSAEKRLLAAVVPAPGATVDPAALRDALAARLPAYMVPVLWAVVDRVPLTANGKVDRRALASVAAPAGQGRGPGAGSDPGAGPTAKEELAAAVTALFAEVLSGPPAEVAADTDFFRAGGNSMGAVRLVRLVRDRFEVSLGVRDFLRTPTPDGLRQLVEAALGADSGGAG